MVLQGFFEIGNSIKHFNVGIIKLLQSDRIVFLGLLVVEFKLFAFAVLFPLLIDFPVFHAFLMPFLHESSVSLQLVDLNAAHLLLAGILHLLFLLLVVQGLLSLTFLLV